jgi:hypothetical protein
MIKINGNSVPLEITGNVDFFGHALRQTTLLDVAIDEASSLHGDIGKVFNLLLCLKEFMITPQQMEALGELVADVAKKDTKRYKQFCKTFNPME